MISSEDILTLFSLVAYDNNGLRTPRDKAVFVTAASVVGLLNELRTLRAQAARDSYRLLVETLENKISDGAHATIREILSTLPGGDQWLIESLDRDATVVLTAPSGHKLIINTTVSVLDPSAPNPEG